MKTDLAIALLSAVDMERIGAQGGRVEIATTLHPAKGKNFLRRAFIHLDRPTAIQAFLYAALNPLAVAGPIFMKRQGLRMPKKLLIFGHLDAKNGDFFVTEISPSPE